MKKCCVMDLLFKFRINLNASYLDSKRVRTWGNGWESTRAEVQRGSAIEHKVSNANSCFDIAKHKPCVFWTILANISSHHSSLELQLPEVLVSDGRISGKMHFHAYVLQITHALWTAIVVQNKYHLEKKRNKSLTQVVKATKKWICRSEPQPLGLFGLSHCQSFGLMHLCSTEGVGAPLLRTAQQNKHFKSQTSMNIITILRVIHPNPFVPLPLLSLDVLISVSPAKNRPFKRWCVFLPWRLLQNPHRTAARMKTSLNVEPAHTMEYANECFMQPHYEVWREVASLGYFPDKVLLRSCPRCASSWNRGGGDCCMRTAVINSRKE